MDGGAWQATFNGVTRVRHNLVTKPLPPYPWASLVAQSVKNLPAMRETWVLSVGWEDLEKGIASPGEGNGNPLQYSCLKNPKNRGAWQATVHRDCKDLDMTE